MLINELKSAKNVEYKTCVMAFINCLIISSENVKERNDIRNELIGLKIMDLIISMRKESDGGDLSLQCDVFDEQRISDETISPDVNSHQDIFYNILRQISGHSQYEVPFLHLLQHLLRIEYHNDQENNLPAIIWDSAETLVHRATTLIECKEDAEKLLRLHQKRRGSWDALGNGPSTSSSTSSIANLNCSNQNKKVHVHPTVSTNIPEPCLPIPPPPPPPPGSYSKITPPPPPPPPPLPLSPTKSSDSPQSLTPFSSEQQEFNLNESFKSDFEQNKLPQQEIPKPKSKMKTLNWSKIPSQKVISSNKPNIWSLIATEHRTNCNEIEVDFNELEGLFCQQQTNGSAPNSCQSSPRMPRRAISTDKTSSSSPYNSLERSTKRLSGEYQPIQDLLLLDSKKSLNVNIFLKQHRGSTEEIINLIRSGKHKEIGAERLRNLMKILPEPNEIQLFKVHQDDEQRMPIAERFLLNLITISNYALRIECMLLKEEFESNCAYLKPAIEAITNASRELRDNKLLHEIIYLILVAGNFLNSVRNN